MKTNKQFFCFLIAMSLCFIGKEALAQQTVQGAASSPTKMVAVKQNQTLNPDATNTVKPNLKAFYKATTQVPSSSSTSADASTETAIILKQKREKELEQSSKSNQQAVPKNTKVGIGIRLLEE